MNKLSLVEAAVLRDLASLNWLKSWIELANHPSLQCLTQIDFVSPSWTHAMAKLHSGMFYTRGRPRQRTEIKYGGSNNEQAQGQR